MATSTLVNRCLARGTCGQSDFFNNPDDEESWNSRLMHPYLWRHGEEQTCPQVPRARHLWTICVGGVGGVGGVWEVGEVGGESSLQETVLTTLNQNKNPQAQALLMEYRCVFFFKAYRGSRHIRAFASVYLSPMLCSIDNRLSVWACSVAVVAATMLAYGDRRRRFGAASSSTRLCSEPSQNAWRSLNSQCFKVGYVICLASHFFARSLAVRRFRFARRNSFLFEALFQ